MDSTALVIDSHAIRRDGDMWCLTDLWRAAGSPVDKRPAEWLRKDGAAFVEFVRDSQTMALSHSPENKAFSDVVRTTKGNPQTRTPPETWAHWQIAIAYAKYLSHALHARVNEVYAAYKAGLLVSRSDDRDELLRLNLRIAALEEGRPSLWDRELKRELARLRKIKWDGTGSEPKGLMFAYGRTWRIVLGDTTYEALKARNPYPRDGSLHAQWLQDQRYQLAGRDMIRVLDCARRCTTWTQFEDDLRAVFKRAPTQLRLVAGKAR